MTDLMAILLIGLFGAISYVNLKEKEKIYEKLKKTIELFYKTYKEEVKEWEKK